MFESLAQGVHLFIKGALVSEGSLEQGQGNRSVFRKIFHGATKHVLHQDARLLLSLTLNPQQNILSCFIK